MCHVAGKNVFAVGVDANGTSGIFEGTRLAALSTSPIGWLDAVHLVVAARPTGRSGPADVWIVDGSGLAQQVLAAVDVVSVRSVEASFGELPDNINSQAPG